MKKTKKLIGVLLAVVLSLGLATSAVFADTVTPLVDVTVTEGFLTVTAPAAVMPGVTVKTTLQTISGWIGDEVHTVGVTGVNVIDERGTGAGWSATMAITHLTHRAPVKILTGTDAVVDFTGVYDGLLGISVPPATFEVRITTGGIIGTGAPIMVFEWRRVIGGVPDVWTSVTPAAGVYTHILSNGISVVFATGTTYLLHDKWSAAVDVFPYTGLVLAPSAIFVESGDLTLAGVSVGAGGTFSGALVTSGPLSMMLADVNHGLGSFWQDQGLTLTIQANPLAGLFRATATLTVI